MGQEFIKVYGWAGNALFARHGQLRESISAQNHEKACGQAFSAFVNAIYEYNKRTLSNKIGMDVAWAGRHPLSDGGLQTKISQWQGLINYPKIIEEYFIKTARDASALPPEGRRIAVDFISFLSDRNFALDLFVMDERKGKKAELLDEFFRGRGGTGPSQKLPLIFAIISLNEKLAQLGRQRSSQEIIVAPILPEYFRFPKQPYPSLPEASTAMHMRVMPSRRLGRL